MKSMQRIATISPGRKLWILVGSLFLTIISVEFLTRVMHDHRKVTLSIERGVAQALLIRHDPGYQQLLFAGNSLIFEDVSQPAVQQSMGAGFHIYAAGVPGSTYDDWRFGLRALFDRGSQPDVLVFSISPSQFLRPTSVTPIPVSQLWTTREVFAYTREQRVGLTAFSELVFEHYSTFFSLRNTVRIYVRKFIPGYEVMLDSWGRSAPVPPMESGPNAEAAFAERLSGLVAACDSHTRLVLMIAPTNQVADAALEPALRAAAEKTGIAVIEPVGERQWPIIEFQEDGYHLNPAAADKFSKLVAADLKSILDDSTPHDSGQ